MEHVVQFKKQEEGSADKKSSDGSSDSQALEIEARVVNNSILMRIHCRKQKGALARLLRKVESLNMVVVNTSVASFSTSALDITIIAEMEEEFSMTVEEIAVALRASLTQVD